MSGGEILPPPLRSCEGSEDFAAWRADPRRGRTHPARPRFRGSAPSESSHRGAVWPGIQEREDLILITVTETESALDTQIQLERVGAFGRPETGAKNTGQPRWRQGV